MKLYHIVNAAVIVSIAAIISTTVVRCHKPKDVPVKPRTAESYVEEVRAIKYASVRYVGDGIPPYVEVKDQDGNVYQDRGTDEHSARYQFDNYYKLAFNAEGVITTWRRTDGTSGIDDACFSCTQLQQHDTTN